MKRILSFVLMMVLGMGLAFAQGNITVSGTVLDEQGQPMIALAVGNVKPVKHNIVPDGVPSVEERLMLKAVADIEGCILEELRTLQADRQEQAEHVARIVAPAPLHRPVLPSGFAYAEVPVPVYSETYIHQPPTVKGLCPLRAFHR